MSIEHLIALHVPPMRFGSNKLPVGLQIIGNYFAEAQMLNGAHQYQLATDHHLQSSSIYLSSDRYHFARCQFGPCTRLIGITRYPSSAN